MKLSIAILMFTSLITISAHAEWSEAGRVIYVDDGDTIGLLRSDNSTVKIRLSSIDAPEARHGNKKPGQPFSKKAKDLLHSMAHGKNAEAHCYENDIYGRSVCNVIVNATSMSTQLVSSGLAWVNTANRRYLRDHNLISLQSTAKGARIGLWYDPEPIAPWVWRKTCWVELRCELAGE